MIDNLEQQDVSVEVKGMWFKILDEQDNIKEIILPIREPNTVLRQSYLKDVKILDQHLTTQQVNIPYSVLMTDGEVETIHYTSKYVAERGDV